MLRALLFVVVVWTMATPALAVDVLATVFQFTAPDPETDPDPTLSGVIRIDTETGVAEPFIAENPGIGFAFLTDVAVGPHNGRIYASSLAGTITEFDASGTLLGVYAALTSDGVNFDGVNSITFADDGTLYAATNTGLIAEIDSTGARQADVISGLTNPSDVTLGPSGELFVTTGNVGDNTGGQVLQIVSGQTPTVVVPSGSIGGGSGVLFLGAEGDVNGDYVNDTADITAWDAAYGANDSPADANGDGFVDAGDYTIIRDAEGDTSKLIITDFAQDSTGNQLYEYDLDAQSGATLATLPTDLLPDSSLPGYIDTNAPTEVLLTEEGTLLVSTAGATQRPNNHAALLEYSQDGVLLNTIATTLPPLSGIALAPVVATAIPEPSAIVLAALAVIGIQWRRM